MAAVLCWAEAAGAGAPLPEKLAPSPSPESPIYGSSDWYMYHPIKLQFYSQTQYIILLNLYKAVTFYRGLTHSRLVTITYQLPNNFWN